MKGLDIKNSRLDKLIYRFRGEWWSYLSLGIAIASGGLILDSIGCLTEDTSVGAVLLSLVLWGALVQLPETVLLKIRNRRKPNQVTSSIEVVSITTSTKNVTHNTF